MFKRTRSLLRKVFIGSIALLLIYLLCREVSMSDLYKKRNNYIFYYINPNISYRIDNSLINRQSHFVLPPENGSIFGWIKFAVFPIGKPGLISDRIYSQMRYVPVNYQREKRKKRKLILLYNGDRGMRDSDFDICPVKHCRITGNRDLAVKADVIIWITDISYPTHVRPPGQVWGFFFHESPEHTPHFRFFENKPNSLINWSISFRPDSTMTVPYNKYSPYDLVNQPPKKYPPPKKNYASGKTKLVAWFVTNCRAANDRYDIAKKIGTFIPVDIYGACGKLYCPRNETAECFKMLNRDYKFYLSFENSYCRHYITEKFFVNGLSHNVVPIVLGAHPQDYKRVAPPHSYIHVEDFATLQDLVNYLVFLDKNDTAYNEYFGWKRYGTVLFDQYWHCRLCMLSHEAKNTVSYYPSFFKWWKGDNRRMCFKTGKWT